MSEQARRQSNRDRVLELLRAKGPAGATNSELLEVGGYRYGGRLHEIRQQWDVASIHEHDGRWRFVLRGPRQPGQGVLWQELA